MVGAKLVRSAYSTIMREASDASAALLDPNGQAVAQAELMIQQLGSLSAAFEPCVEHHPVDTLVEGDFCINNDPYHGGQHLPDVFIFSPVFFEGELVAFGATVAQGHERVCRARSADSRCRNARSPPSTPHAGSSCPGIAPRGRQREISG